MKNKLAQIAFNNWRFNTPVAKVMKIYLSDKITTCNTPLESAFWLGTHGYESKYESSSIAHAVWRAGKSWKKSFEPNKVK